MSALSFNDAKTRNAAAQAALDAVHDAKRRAATKDPGSSGQDYEQKAAGRRWVGANAFDRLAARFRP